MKFWVALFVGGLQMERKKIFEKRWQLASSEQRARYNDLLTSYPAIDWTYKEKKYFLWLCQLDIDTFETFEVILEKLNMMVAKKQIIWNEMLFYLRMLILCLKGFTKKYIH